MVAAMLLNSPCVCAQLPQIGGRSNGLPTAERRVQEPGREDWYRIEFDGKAVGYESLITTAVTSRGSDSNASAGLLRRIRDTRLKLRRFGTDLSVSARLETIETSDGILHSWSLRRSSADGSTTERTGIWNSEKSGMEITEKSGTTSRRQLLTSVVQPRSAIFPAWMSAASSETSRLWTSAVFFPETVAIVDVEIHQSGQESLQLANGKMVPVTRYEYWPTNNPEMKSSVFYDEQRSPILIEQSLIGSVLRLERTDAASALGQESMESLDLQFSSVLPLKRQISNLDRSQSLRLKITAGASEQISLPTSEFQTVEQTSGHELFVTLRIPAIVENNSPQPPNDRSKTQIDPSYTTASRWITSDHEDLRRMGIVAAGGTSIPLEKCRRLTRHVWKQMRLSPFSTSLQPASAIIKTMRGDCTEHAVLLSTLMRSEGVPSRVVVGFVYVSNPASYAPHMWTEAFLDGRWIPFDSTRGPDGIGLTHIKVNDSTLSDDVGSGTLLFVPLLSFLGRAAVDVAQN